ncbi:DNRLRE domain-containing protein, partial [bacterium]
MRKVFKRRIWMQVIAIILVMALNLGALDGLIRVTVQELALGSFDGFLKDAAAKNVEVEKNKNTLPDSAGPKKHVNPVAEEAWENREVKEKRTPNSKTYKIGEEEYKTEVFQDPIHYVNEKNELVDIDNTLVQSVNKDFAFENRANSLKVRFTDKSGEKKLGQIQQKESSIQWSLLDGKEVTGNTAQNTITYSGIKENADLRYIIDGSTLKEEIILNTSDAPAEFKFALDLKNLDYKAQEDGSINFVESRTGAVVWRMPKPYMYDAKGVRSEAVTAALEYKWGRLVLTVQADREWISAPDRQLPIVIDPTIQPGPSDGRDTFISSSNPDDNYRSNDYLYTGSTPAYGDTRSFFYFDNLTTEKDITVTDAKFYAYATAGSLTSVNLYPVQVDWEWDTNTLDWNFWQRSGKLGGLVDTANGANGWWNFDVKNLVQQWVDNPAANFGLALVPASASGYREFISCD